MVGRRVSAVLTRLDPLEERKTWLAWRRHGIGGSDIAGLAGLSRFATPTSIYLDKTGQLTDDDDNAAEHLLWGRLLEHPIGREFSFRTQLHLIGEQIAASNPAHTWERCTLDALLGESPTTNLDHALGVLEIKNVAAYGWDDVPDEYACQVLWQLAITELDVGYLAVLHGGRRLGVYTIERDERAIAALRTMAYEFWHYNVLAGVPPAVDGHRATTDALKDAYRELAVADTAVELDEDALALRWLAAKAHAKASKAQLDAIENELRTRLGTATALTHNGDELVTWKPQNTRASFDLEGLERDYPVIAAKYRGEKGTTRVLRATKALNERHNTA